MNLSLLDGICKDPVSKYVHTNKFWDENYNLFYGKGGTSQLMIKRNREQRGDKNVKVISGFIWEFKGEFCLEGLEA